eukprot:Pgem_evm1s4194
MLTRSVKFELLPPKRLFEQELLVRYDFTDSNCEMLSTTRYLNTARICNEVMFMLMNDNYNANDNDNDNDSYNYN